MGDRDKDHPLICIDEIEKVFSWHIAKDQKEKIDATENGHQSKARKDCSRWLSHDRTLNPFVSLIERKPQDKQSHKPPDDHIGNMLPVEARDSSGQLWWSDATAID